MPSVHMNGIVLVGSMHVKVQMICCMHHSAGDTLYSQLKPDYFTPVGHSIDTIQKV